ncbi:MAG: divalent-cation tolerance protein CutA [Gammaproteobacteria bacterium]|jgi:periplasmic divalent cation tolerance protein|nr:divalent-cation tolerance protein CutA [Gammaproteobacteria bacterium]
MATDALLVLCTCPDVESAQRIAHQLVASRLAACVNLLPGLTSVYRWDDAVQTAEETLLLVKTGRACYAALEETLRAIHPYELPEIVALPVEQGLAGYLDWIRQCTNLS